MDDTTTVWSSPLWRDVLAVVCGALTFVCCATGLMLFWPSVQGALVAGLAVGLISRSPLTAAAAGALGCAVASLLAPANGWGLAGSAQGRLFDGLVAVVVGALVAAGVRALAARRKGAAGPVLAAAVVLIVANLWVTAYFVGSQATANPQTNTVVPSFQQQIRGDIPDYFSESDATWFFRVYRWMQDGEPYYPAFNRALEANERWSASTVLNVRMPTLFYLWAALPDAGYVLALFLVLASAAAVSVFPAMVYVSRLPVAIPACAAIAAYFLVFAVQMRLFSQEAWGAAVGVICIGAYGLSMGSARWRAWDVAAVCLALVAALMRELQVFVLLGGFAAAWLVPREQRRSRLLSWGAGLAAFAALYAAHYWAVSPYLDYVEGSNHFGKGGLDFMVAALTYATDLLGGKGAFPIVLAALGVLGAVALRASAYRLFALVATIAPLATFLLVGNGAWNRIGAATNYWGASVLPLIYVFIPAALALIPTARVRNASVGVRDEAAVEGAGDLSGEVAGA